MIGTAVIALSLAASAPQPILVFFVAGQSNAVGGNPLSELPAYMQQPRPDILFHWSIETSEVEYTSNGFVPLEPTMVPGQTWGPEIPMAHSLADSLGAPIAIVKVAANGASLHARWGPDDSDLYSRLLCRWRDASTRLVQMGYIPVPAGFAWIQGASDSYVPWSTLYEGHLEELWGALAKDIGGMPFVQGQQHPACPTCTDAKTVRQAKENFGAAAWAVTFETMDLSMRPDLIHYDGPGLLQYGARLADGMRQARTDIDVSGSVSVEDLLMLLANWE